MQKLFPRCERLPLTAGMLCLLFAASLAGCASKNPLIDDEAAVTTSGTAPAQQKVAAAQQKAATGQQKAAQAAAPAAEASGVTTTEPTGLRRFLGIFSPYRIDIQQGNFISREMVAELKEGMQRKEGVSREQVRFALGTPLLTDIFHADRWDYLFRLQKGNGEVISSRVTVYFDNNRLARIEGGELPTEKEYLALIAGAAPGTPAKSGK